MLRFIGVFNLGLNEEEKEDIGKVLSIIYKWESIRKINERNSFFFFKYKGE